MLNTIRKWLSPRGQGEVSVRNFFDAAGSGNRLQNWTPASTNWAVNLRSEPLKQRARDLHRNDPTARRLVQMFGDDAVGASGLTPQFSGPYRKEAQALWLSFSETADFSGRYDLAGFLRQCVETLIVDGELIVRAVPAPQLPVPIQLQNLTSEFMDSSRVGDTSAHGIEYNPDGRRAGYWLYSRHPAAPGPTLRSVLVPQLGTAGSAFGAVHLFEPMQPGIERGVSRLAPVSLALHELRTAMEAARVRIQVSSLLCGFAISDGTNPLNATNTPNGFSASLEPGTFAKLDGTQSVEFTDPPELGSTFDPFVKAQLRAIAAGMGVPYELLACDVGAVTFASGRHSILAYRRRLETLQHTVLVAQLLRPVLTAWLRLAISLGLLPGGVQDYPVRWIGPTIQALDQKAEVETNVLKVRAGFTSRAEVISSEGEDPETVDTEIAADNARAESLGLVMDSNPAQVSRQGQEQQGSSPGDSSSAS